MDLTPSLFAISKYLAIRALLAVGWLCLAAALVHAGQVSTTQCYDTFLNSQYPTNNNGGSTTFFTGQSGQGGIMRALIRCDLPAAINERTAVTQVTLTLRTAGLGSAGTTAPTAATEYLQALTEPWGEGNKAGETTGTYTVGSACTAGEATWSLPLCSIVNWTTAGGTVAAAASASASSPASIGAGVTFTSNSGGMVTDVQSWAATPASNYGWRISSSTEGGSAQAQRFNSSEAAAGIPTLAMTYGCKPGFQDTGNGCTACTTAAQSACVTSQLGNTCVDPGPPSGYSCSCNNAAYIGTGTGSCTDRNECVPNYCIDAGDIGALCIDHLAPAIGYDCSCNPGFVFDGLTCSDLIFADGFDM
jgi:hypothetical protein